MLATPLGTLSGAMTCLPVASAAFKCSTSQGTLTSLKVPLLLGRLSKNIHKATIKFSKHLHSSSQRKISHQMCREMYKAGNPKNVLKPWLREICFKVRLGYAITQHLFDKLYILDLCFFWVIVTMEVTISAQDWVQLSLLCFSVKRHSCLRSSWTELARNRSFSKFVDLCVHSQALN